MGKTHSSSFRPSLTMKELRPVDEASGIYLNICNNRIYVKNELYINNIADIEYQYDVYNFRRLNDNLVVSVDYCTHSLEHLSCSSCPSLSYYIEQQDYTLFDKDQMDREQATRLLLHVLQGFEILYQRFGYFAPSSKLIFFNRFHHPKVWLNENLRISKNSLFDQFSQSISLENKFVRQIIKIFDALRDPQDPMFCYSKCLPPATISFKAARDIFERNQAERLSRRLRCGSPFREIHNIRRLASPVVSRQTFMKSAYSSPFQASMSPRFAQRDPLLNQRYEAENPQMRINFLSPTKRASCGKEGEFKDSVKYSLKRTNSDFFSKNRGSKEFTSTMPNSLKNSRTEEKVVFIEALTPVMQSYSSVHPGYSITSSKMNPQRFSGCEPTSFGKQLNTQQNQPCRPCFDGFIDKQSPVKLSCFPLDESSNKTQRVKAEEENNEELLPVRNEFKMHKRHKTDYKLHQINLGNSSNMSINQKSAIGGTIGKFNVNTIKSIHLLEEDKEVDSSIITDLKQIINKYRLTDRSRN